MVVHSIRISEQAETKVENLADHTGGFKTYSDGNSSARLIDAFRILIDSARDGNNNSGYQKYWSISNYLYIKPVSINNNNLLG